jgi:hypothetical protein
MEEADPSVPEAMRWERRNASVAAGTSDGGPQTVTWTDWEERRVEVPVLARRQRHDDELEQIVRQLDPACPSRLRDFRSHEPCLAPLIEIGDASRFELADPSARRIEDDQAEQVDRREEPAHGLDMLGDRGLDLVRFL